MKGASCFPIYVLSNCFRALRMELQPGLTWNSQDLVVTSTPGTQSLQAFFQVTSIGHLYCGRK